VDRDLDIIWLWWRDSDNSHNQTCASARRRGRLHGVDVWSGRAGHLGGEAVQQIDGGVESFYLVASRNRSLKGRGTLYIINGAKNALDFTVPRRSVWIRDPQNHPISGEECTRGGVVELMVIVAVNDFDGAAKLCIDISRKI
jgi:hypothetical protein